MHMRFFCELANPPSDLSRLETRLRIIKSQAEIDGRYFYPIGCRLQEELFPALFTAAPEQARGQMAIDAPDADSSLHGA
jgi:hypothetical protein